MRSGNHRCDFGKRDSGGSPGISSRSSSSIARVVRTDKPGEADLDEHQETEHGEDHDAEGALGRVQDAAATAISTARITMYWNANSRARKRTIHRQTRNTRRGGAPEPDQRGDPAQECERRGHGGRLTRRSGCERPRYPRISATTRSASAGPYVFATISRWISFVPP